MAGVYYNENNPQAVAMLKQLMRDGLVPKGDIDDRSITDVQPSDLAGYTQCHFFAGIGGWAIALILAGWPEDREVWTGSCPCQPFSTAGRQKGKADDRHLWPVWERLIGERLPASVYGEQVESAIAHGWLDDVYQGLEPEGYAVGSAVLPACCVGAPHRRNREWFVAHHNNRSYGSKEKIQTGRDAAFDGSKKSMGDDQGNRERSRRRQSGQGERPKISNRGSGIQPIHHTQRSRLEGQPRNGSSAQGWEIKERSITAATGWDAAYWHACTDGKTRLVPTEPDVFPLAHGFQHRRWLLHAAGNAIVPQVAAEFIKAAM